MFASATSIWNSSCFYLHQLGRQICETLKSFQPYQDAKSISVYLAMPTAEVQTDSIVRHALDSGKQVFVPYLYKYPITAPDIPSRAMDMVKLDGIQDYENLKRDSWGIPSVDAVTVHERPSILGASGFQRPQEGGPEPQLEPDAFALDLMLMPGVAFDVDEAGSIRRLGHGRGFYDFFVNRYTAQHGTGKTILLYGLALTEQIVPATSEVEIPMGEHDRSLDGLVVGNGDIKHKAS